MEGKNEPVNFSSLISGNYFLELQSGNYQDKEVSQELDIQFDIILFSWIDDINWNIVDLVTNVGDVTNPIHLEDRFWILDFDGSKTQKGSKVGCVLVDTEINKLFLSYRIDFKCTNNTA